MELGDARILITGASSGLGAHFARALSGAGASVALAARRRDRLEALSDEIAAAGGRAEVVTIDVSDPASVQDGVAAADAALGGLNGLVNNAGVAHAGPALETSEAAWRRVMDANLDGVFRVAQAAARVMAAHHQASGAPGGAIVNVASILGIRVQPGLAAYCASKAGVDHLTKALALEWARYGIRVNALAPGYFPTEINEGYLTGEAGEKMKKVIPMRRFGELSDLDGPLKLLIGPAGRYMTGVTVPVDGGHLVSPL